METQQPTIIRVWFHAVRFPRFTMTFIPVAMGGAFAVADRAFDGFLFLLSLIAAMFIQAGANLINDYYDFLRGADNEHSLSVSGVIQRGWLSPQQVKYGGLACFLIAAGIGAYLVKMSGTFLLFIGMIGILLAFFYTAGPYPLAYRAWGELAVFFLMGPLMVLGTYYVQIHLIRPGIAWGAVPIGLLTTATLHANNLRDIEHDLSIKKKTIATLVGKQRSKRISYLLIGGTFFIHLLLALFHILPWLSLLSFLTLPLAWRIVKRIISHDSPLQLNLALGLTVLLHLLYGVLLVLGMFISTLFW